MKIPAFCAALVSLFLSAAAPADPLVHVAIATHNEDMANANTPDTPLASSLIDYSNFRRGVFYFANTLNTLGIPWNWQSEWNFLEGCRQWEITSPQIFPDNTGGLNIVRWLRETRGVECNAHSHEGYGYNYADVAWMLRTYFGVPDTHLNTVGGVIYASNHPNFLHWEKFYQTNGDGTTGLQPQHYATDAGTWRWNPRLLMGAGTPSHALDGAVTGMWRPAALADYFNHADTGPMVAIGNAGGTVARVQELITLIESGRLEAGKMRTATFVFDSALFYQPAQAQPYGFVDATAVPVLNQLKALEAQGKIAFIQFRNTTPTWQAQFTSAASNWPPQDCVSFHWNTQDFIRPDLTAAYFHRLLDLHEQFAVPVDVFLTETMLDVFESAYPALLARLKSSAMVCMDYHVRPPKPYYTGSDIGSTTGYNFNNWSGINGLTGNLAGGALYNFIANYETHGLSLTTGAPTAATGGFAKMTGVFGYAPIVAAAQSDSVHAIAVSNVFKDLGAKMSIRHNVVNNLGDVANFQNVKPEANEIRLIELFKAGLVTPAASAFDSAIAAARIATSGSGTGTRYAYAPYFMGVKLHDNDMFTDTSAWIQTYTTPTGRKTPAWQPFTNPNVRALLTGTTPEDRFNYYAAMLQYAAANRAKLQLVHAPHILDMLAIARPARVTLSHTTAVERNTNGGAGANAVVATLGSTLDLAGAAVAYSLVSGAGGDDNAAFTLSGGVLRTIAGFNYEQKSSYSIRVRAQDGSGGIVEQTLSVIVENSTADDDDGDGATEAAELAAGTDPQNPASHFQIVTISHAASSVTLIWTSVSGRSYIVQSANAAGGAWADAGGAIVASGPTTPATVTGVSANAMFFRVRTP